ncbi:helix-turn-helix domain-containing protein [Streptomyces sp. NPDC052020]|uniref:transcriptional regulator n=1 Tax=Streptomyces sp. NPDC052020 TaxID=3155677 RepID=UPI0034326ED3
MTGDTAAAEFAALLRELKERSGLSYGVLARRLHMSTSTLHRYCNGDAVPTDYAPVERLARLCKASPGELVELHRRWVLADATRGRKGAGAASRAGATGAAETSASGSAGPTGSLGSADPPGSGDATGAGGASGPGGTSGSESLSGADSAAGSESASGAGDDPGTGDDPGADRAAARETAALPQTPSSGGPPARARSGQEPPGEVPRPEDGPPPVEMPQGPERPAPPRGPRRTRAALAAGTAVAAVAGLVALAVSLPADEADEGRRSPAGAVSAEPEATGGTRASASASRSAAPSPSSSHRQKGEATATAAGPSASASRDRGAGTGAGAGGGDGKGPAVSGARAGVPLTVSVQPYTWQGPCDQRYLVNRPPQEVSPPPQEQDAPGWVAAFGAVSSGQQFVTLTVQGTGEETVVLKSLKVRTAGKRSPLPWNDYVMGYPGVGCGGGVPERFFTVALDAARPAVVPEAGGADFPFKVSESDPEVYHVLADASAYDVRWYLELEWSSGSRHGTLEINDNGRPFRTSGNNGRPAYEFPLGGEKWVEEGTTNGAAG